MSATYNIAREAYMGDGLYASHDVCADTIWLRAPRFSGNQLVALERQVLRRFIAYACEMGYGEDIERAMDDRRERTGT
jgi:hypothetical protein